MSATPPDSIVPSSTSATSSDTATGTELVQRLPRECFKSNHETVETQVIQEGIIDAFIEESRMAANTAQNPSQDLPSLLLQHTPLPPDLIGIVAEYRLTHVPPIIVSPPIGPRHHDSRPFRAIPENVFTAIQRGWSIRQIIGWGDHYCNGVQFVYGPSSISEAIPSPLPLPEAKDDLEHHQDSWTTADSHGNHHGPRRIFQPLAPDEYIDTIVWRGGVWTDSIEFHTNLNVFRIGTSNGGTEYVYSAPFGTGLIGLFGTVGGHIHSIQPIFAAIETQKTARRRSIDAGAKEEKLTQSGNSETSSDSNANSSEQATSSPAIPKTSESKESEEANETDEMQALAGSTTLSNTTHTRLATDPRPPHLESQTALSAHLVANPHLLLAGGEYVGIVPQVKRSYVFHFFFHSVEVTKPILGDRRQHVTGRVWIDEYGEKGPMRFEGEGNLRTSMLEISILPSDHHGEIPKTFTAHVFTTAEHQSLKVSSQCLALSFPSSPGMSTARLTNSTFNAKLNVSFLLPMQVVEGCPIASCPVTTLALVCRLLSLRELIDVAQSSKQLSSAASHPLTFSHGIKVDIDTSMGVWCRGPTSLFLDQERLSLALQSRLLSNFKLMRLKNPFRSQNPTYLYRMLHTLIQKRETSLHTLTIDAEAHASFWAQQQIPPPTPTMRKDLVQKTSSRIALNGQPIVANNGAVLNDDALHTHIDDGIERIALPSEHVDEAGLPLKAVQLKQHRHALTFFPRRYCGSFTCELCHLLNGGNPNLEAAFSCPTCSWDVCTRCFENEGGFLLPPSDFHVSTHDEIFSQLARSRAMEFVRVFTVQGAYTLLPIIFRHLPPHVEVVEFTILNPTTYDPHPIPSKSVPPFDGFLPENFSELVEKSTLTKLILDGEESFSHTKIPANLSLPSKLRSTQGIKLADLIQLQKVSALPNIELLFNLLVLHPEMLQEEIDDFRARNKDNPAAELPKVGKMLNLNVGEWTHRTSPAILTLFPNLRSMIITHFSVHGRPEVGRVEPHLLDWAPPVPWPREMVVSLRELCVVRCLLTEALVDTLTVAGLTNLVRLVLQGDPHREQVDLEAMCASMPNLMEMTLRKIHVAHPETAFRHLTKLQSLREFIWTFEESSKQADLGSKIFPALTFLHVSEAKEKIPWEWAEALCSIRTLQSVRWRREKKLAPLKIREYFRNLAEARVRITKERALADAAEAKAMQVRLDAKAERVAAIAPKDAADANWFKGSYEVGPIETPDEIAARVRREYQQKLVTEALAKVQIASPFEQKVNDMVRTYVPAAFTVPSLPPAADIQFGPPAPFLPRPVAVPSSVRTVHRVDMRFDVTPNALVVDHYSVYLERPNANSPAGIDTLCLQVLFDHGADFSRFYFARGHNFGVSNESKEMAILSRSECLDAFVNTFLELTGNEFIKGRRGFERVEEDWYDWVDPPIFEFRMGETVHFDLPSSNAAFTLQPSASPTTPAPFGLTSGDAIASSSPPVKFKKSSTRKSAGVRAPTSAADTSAASAPSAAPFVFSPAAGSSTSSPSVSVPDDELSAMLIGFARSFASADPTTPPSSSANTFTVPNQ